MIVGIGIDMIEVARVASKIDKDNGFRESVFSEREMATCEGLGSREESYAGRFAAKEAFLKATGMGLMLGYSLADIEVINDEMGKPCLNLRGRFEEYMAQKGWKTIHVSITHTKTAAAAVVVIES